MNKTGVFTIEIQKESKGNRTYKKYDINFICEFTWNNTTFKMVIFSRLYFFIIFVSLVLEASPIYRKV